MHFDHGRRELNGAFFSYVDDPEIHKVRTGKAGIAGMREGARGIPSGGITITVDGINFDEIREPRMYVLYKGKEYRS
ncbi:UNVERIFIED_CONTAM: hypothetical protein GTU68_062945, partial [Idotea baltica]|nr:hypothetical protein [Idotea baltica]